MTLGSLPVVAQYGRGWAYWVLTQSALKQGDKQGATERLKEMMRYNGEGAAAERLRTLPELLSWWVQYVPKKRPGDSFTLAKYNATAGRNEEALADLERQCRNGGEQVLFVFTAVEPVFDALHGDPRFLRVVDCTRLPPDAPVRQTLRPETRR
jgi:hypothetical protein